jgi:threonine/homoserine efflux transporter RhtA
MFARVATDSNEDSAPITQGHPMNIQLSLAPIISLLAGILILVQPKLLNYIVAIYLIVIGILGLVGRSGMQLN